jgi:aldehyde:ferredoxin oxidoreductase
MSTASKDLKGIAFQEAKTNVLVADQNMRKKLFKERVDL